MTNRQQTSLKNHPRIADFSRYDVQNREDESINKFGIENSSY